MLITISLSLQTMSGTNEGRMADCPAFLTYSRQSTQWRNSTAHSYPTHFIQPVSDLSKSVIIN